MTTYVFNQNVYRKNIKKQTSAFFPIVFFLIIILVGIAIFLNTKNTNQTYFYFVKIDSFSTYSEANTLATKLQSQNASGYIHFDEKYHVLASFYPTKKQAQNVAERLIEKYPNVNVYSISITKFNGKNQLTKKQNNSIFDLTDNIETSIFELYDLIVDYEKNQISSSITGSKISRLIDIFDEEKTDFFSIVNNPKYHNQRSCIDKISSSLNRIKSSTNEQNLTQTLRYEIISIVFNYAKFCSLF